MLSLHVEFESDLLLPSDVDGEVWRYACSGQEFRPHRHAELEMNLVTAGRAAYILGDRRYEMERGSLVWLFPGQDHILLDESPDHVLWVGVFKPELIHRLCVTPFSEPLLQRNPPGRFCRSLGREASERLHHLLLELFDAREDTARYNAGLGYVLLTAWAAFHSAEDIAAGRDVHFAVENAARLLRDETDLLTVQQIAARVGLSASRLSRLFHQQTGIALTDFRNRQRMERFLRAYSPGRGGSVLDAALEAGFGSYAQFYRVFAQHMGCGPAEHWRRIAEQAANTPSSL